MADFQASSDSVKNKVECVICKDDKNTSRDPIIVVEDCCVNAIYHQECIRDWLQEKNTCPACTKKLEVSKNDKVIKECMINKCDVNLGKMCLGAMKNKYLQSWVVCGAQFIIGILWMTNTHRPSNEKDADIKSIQFDIAMGYFVLTQTFLIFNFAYYLLDDIKKATYYGKEITSWFDNITLYPIIFFPCVFNLILNCLVFILGDEQREIYLYSQAGFWFLTDIYKNIRFYRYITHHRNMPWDFEYDIFIVTFAQAIGCNISIFLMIEKLSALSSHSSLWNALIYPILGFNVIYWFLRLVVYNCAGTPFDLAYGRNADEIKWCKCTRGGYDECGFVINYPLPHTNKSCWAKFNWVYYVTLPNSEQRINVFNTWIKYQTKNAAEIIADWLTRIYWTYNITMVTIPVTVLLQVIDIDYLLGYLLLGTIFQYLVMLGFSCKNFCQEAKVITQFVIKGAKAAPMPEHPPSTGEAKEQDEKVAI